MKRILSLFLTLVMVLSIITSVPVIVNAASVDDLTFELNEGRTMYKITGVSDDVSGSLVIPSAYNGLPVTRIDSVGHVPITSITIPSSITSIGSCAFCYLYNLKEVHITDIVSWCNIYFGGNSCMTHGTATNPLEAAHNLYLNGELVTDLVVPGSVTKIANDAFCGCNSIVNVKITEGVKSIGDSAFHNCLSLANVILADTVTEIGGAAFEDCKNLKNITIPDSVTSIGFMAFYGSGLKSIIIPKSVAEIESRAFGYKYDSWLNKGVKIDGFTIYGYEGTAAEKYAKDNGFEFIKIECKQHSSSDWIIDKAATVNAAGKKHKECTECGKVLKTETIAQLKCSKPTLKSIENTQYGVLTKWGKVSGADKYYIYRKTSGGSYSRIGSTTKTYYTDKTAKSGKKYYYIVKAVNEAGSSSSSSSKSILHLADSSMKSIVNTEYGVKITWGKVSGAEEYNVYRKTSGGSYSKIATTKNAYYTDKKAKSGKKYYYIVKAVKSSTTSASSNAKSIYHLADTTLKTPSSTKSGVKLTWNKVTGAEGYMVYRKTGSGSYSKIATVKGNSKVTYTDKSAKKGKKYTYKIKSYKSKTYSAYSNTKTITDKY